MQLTKTNIDLSVKLNFTSIWEMVDFASQVRDNVPTNLVNQTRFTIEMATETDINLVIFFKTVQAFQTFEAFLAQYPYPSQS